LHRATADAIGIMACFRTGQQGSDVAPTSNKFQNLRR
jgi:hypothetical protein